MTRTIAHSTTSRFLLAAFAAGTLCAALALLRGGEAADDRDGARGSGCAVVRGDAGEEGVGAELACFSLTLPPRSPVALGAVAVESGMCGDAPPAAPQDTYGPPTNPRETCFTVRIRDGAGATPKDIRVEAVLNPNSCASARLADVSPDATGTWRWPLPAHCAEDPDGLRLSMIGPGDVSMSWEPPKARKSHASPMTSDGGAAIQTARGSWDIRLPRMGTLSGSIDTHGLLPDDEAATLRLSWSTRQGFFGSVTLPFVDGEYSVRDALVGHIGGSVRPAGRRCASIPDDHALRLRDDAPEVPEGDSARWNIGLGEPVLSVKVIDAFNGAPIAGAEVEVPGNPPWLTDAEGCVDFQALQRSPRGHSVTVTHRDYATRRAMPCPEPGASTAGSLLLVMSLEHGATLRGRVVDGQGAALGGVFVSCRHESHGAYDCGPVTCSHVTTSRTDAEGWFELSRVRTGTGMLLEIRDGPERALTERIEVREGAPPRTWVLEGFPVIRGRVLEADGTPVIGGFVTAISVEHALSDVRCGVDADGLYVIDELQMAGEYLLIADGPHHEGRQLSRRLRLAPGAADVPLIVDFVFPPEPAGEAPVARLTETIELSVRITSGDNRRPWNGPLILELRSKENADDTFNLYNADLPPETRTLRCRRELQWLRIQDPSGAHEPFARHVDAARLRDGDVIDVPLQRWR